MSNGSAGSGPASFTVHTKDNRILQYGSAADSRIEAQGRADALYWLLEKVEDQAGNFIQYDYLEDPVNGEYRIDEIRYTLPAEGGAADRVVAFQYEDRPDDILSYLGGSKQSTTKRLTNVKTWVGAQQVRDYKLSYHQSNHSQRSLVQSIQECAWKGGDEHCLPATSFSWDEPTQLFAEDPGFNWNPDEDFGAEKTYKLFDLNGDGKKDAINYNGVMWGTHDGFGSIDALPAGNTVWTSPAFVDISLARISTSGGGYGQAVFGGVPG